MVEPLEGAPAEGVETEQRRGGRARADVEATILPFSDAFALRAMQVSLRDVSRGGFGFLHERPVPLGESFGLVLAEREGPPAIVLCNVVFWQPISKDLYTVGAKFTRMLNQPRTELPLVLEDPLQVRRAS